MRSPNSPVPRRVRPRTPSVTRQGGSATRMYPICRMRVPDVESNVDLGPTQDLLVIHRGRHFRILTGRPAARCSCRLEGRLRTPFTAGVPGPTIGCRNALACTSATAHGPVGGRAIGGSALMCRDCAVRACSWLPPSEDPVRWTPVVTAGTAIREL